MSVYEYNCDDELVISVDFKRKDLPALIAVREALSAIAKDVIDSRTNYCYLEELGKVLGALGKAAERFGKEEDDEQRDPDGAAD